MTDRGMLSSSELDHHNVQLASRVLHMPIHNDTYTAKFDMPHCVLPQHRHNSRTHIGMLDFTTILNTWFTKENCAWNTLAWLFLVCLQINWGWRNIQRTRRSTIMCCLWLLTGWSKSSLLISTLPSVLRHWNIIIWIIDDDYSRHLRI